MNFKTLTFDSNYSNYPSGAGVYYVKREKLDGTPANSQDNLLVTVQGRFPYLRLISVLDIDDNYVDVSTDFERAVITKWYKINIF